MNDMKNRDKFGGPVIRDLRAFIESNTPMNLSAVEAALDFLETRLTDAAIHGCHHCGEVERGAPCHWCGLAERARFRGKIKVASADLKDTHNEALACDKS